MSNTYGNGGNRWWIGQNVGETGSQSTIFRTPSLSALNPGVPTGYESLPSGNAADDAQFAAAAAKNKGSKSPNTISVQNVEWYNIQGPYTTQAAANAAIPAIQAATPAKGTAGQVADDNNSNPVGAIAGAAANAESDVSSIEGFLSGLTSANLWIRVAKVTVGSIILIVGLVKLTGVASNNGIAKKALEIAPLL
jgi:hypothetical protein